MDEPTRFDRLRAWAEQGEPPTALDAELRELFDEYRTVHALTGLDAFDDARPQLSFDELAQRLPGERSSRVFRRVAVAATVLAAVLWMSKSSPSAQAVVLHHIPAAGSIERTQADPGARSPSRVDDDDLPASWIEFDPRGEGERVRWLEDLDGARLLAGAARRPLLVYGYMPGCPMCAALDKLVFADEGVVEAAERFVPLRLNLAAMPKQRAYELVTRGYPFLEVWSADDSVTQPLTREPRASAFVDSLLAALVAVRARDDAPSWEVVRARSRRLAEALGGERSGELALAEETFVALASACAPGDVFAERACAGLARIEHGAAEELARARAETDVAAARERLRDARELYRGTRYEPDFAAVLARVERDGRFPDVEFAPSAP